MNGMIRTTMTGLALSAVILVAPAPARAEMVESLRGGAAIPDVTRPETLHKLKQDDEKIPRTYKQQPPLVPHKVAKYRVNLKENRCLSCHDKANYKEEEATLTGKSHYVDRNGKTHETVVKSRYFCIQCHVPQAEARPLVENTFRGTRQH